MDCVISNVTWPFVIFLSNMKFIIGSIIMLIPYGIHLLQHGKSSLDSFIALFTFLKKYPFGNEVFSGIAAFTGL